MLLPSNKMLVEFSMEWMPMWLLISHEGKWFVTITSMAPEKIS